MAEAQILILTAATIAFAHTVLGPDHYLVFTAMGKARGWSLSRTLRITFYCGVGHVVGSMVLGGVGLFIGAELAALVQIEGVRGSLAGWGLIAFGLMYFAWGLRKAGRSHVHSHVHQHGDVLHTHKHDHAEDHAHVHDAGSQGSITPWALFIIFILGPCEALIPLFMYPAAQHNVSLVVAVATVFGVVTLLTMLACVLFTTLGLSRLKLPSFERYSHAIAGASILVCGSAISFFGL
jgi:sulfite exporter TauE/SafE